MENTDTTTKFNTSPTFSHTFYIHHQVDGIAARSMANSYIAKALYQQKITPNLEGRTLLITVQITDLALGRKIGSKMFGAMRQAIGSSLLSHLSDIAVITCPDVFGSRGGDANLHTNNHPHIHSLLILPQVPAANERTQLDQLLTSALGSIGGVLKSRQETTYARDRDPIHITGIAGHKSYWYVCDYVIKCENKSANNEYFKTDVYPYRYLESHLLNKPKRQLDLGRLHASVDEIYNQLILFPDTYYNHPANIQLSEKHLELAARIEATSNPIMRQILVTKAVRHLEAQPLTFE
jgi:hypothetical protein